MADLSTVTAAGAAAAVAAAKDRDGARPRPHLVEIERLVAELVEIEQTLAVSEDDLKARAVAEAWGADRFADELRRREVMAQSRTHLERRLAELEGFGRDHAERIAAGELAAKVLACGEATLRVLDQLEEHLVDVGVLHASVSVAVGSRPIPHAGIVDRLAKVLNAELFAEARADVEMLMARARSDALPFVAYDESPLARALLS